MQSDGGRIDTRKKHASHRKKRETTAETLIYGGTVLYAVVFLLKFDAPGGKNHLRKNSVVSARDIKLEAYSSSLAALKAATDGRKGPPATGDAMMQ